MQEKTITPVRRIPHDFDWWNEDDPGYYLGEYYQTEEDCDEDGEPLGIFSHSLLINFGRSPGWDYDNKRAFPKSQLIRDVLPTDVCCDCGKDDFGFGFEYAGKQYCLSCFEFVEGIFINDIGYGHQCLDCGQPAAYMFMASNNAFYEHYPKTSTHGDGGKPCLPCFGETCPDFADHLWRIVLHVEPDFIPELFRVLMRV